MSVYSMQFFNDIFFKQFAYSVKNLNFLLYIASDTLIYFGSYFVVIKVC